MRIVLCRAGSSPYTGVQSVRQLRPSVWSADAMWMRLEKRHGQTVVQLFSYFLTMCSFFARPTAASQSVSTRVLLRTRWSCTSPNDGGSAAHRLRRGSLAAVVNSYYRDSGHATSARSFFDHWLWTATQPNSLWDFSAAVLKCPMSTVSRARIDRNRRERSPPDLQRDTSAQPNRQRGTKAPSESGLPTHERRSF